MMFLFSRKRDRFPFEKYTIDPEEYQKARLAYMSQPPLIRRELRAAKICMAVFTPLFSFCSLRHFPAALGAGIITAGISFRLLNKRISVKAAAAAVFSIALGIVFGRTLLRELYAYIRTFSGWGGAA
jgi:hypothetical protein